MRGHGANGAQEIYGLHAFLRPREALNELQQFHLEVHVENSHGAPGIFPRALSMELVAFVKNICPHSTMRNPCRYKPAARLEAAQSCKKYIVFCT
jgi:hypothetical protein